MLPSEYARRFGEVHPALFISSRKACALEGLLDTSGRRSLITNSRAIREQRGANIFVSWNQCQRFSGLLIDTGRPLLTFALPALPRAFNKNHTGTCRHVDLINEVIINHASRLGLANFSRQI